MRRKHLVLAGWIVAAALLSVGCGKSAPDPTGLDNPGHVSVATTTPLPTLPISDINYTNAEIRGGEPIFSVRDAFHEKALEVSLTSSLPNGEIYYTLNGHEPMMDGQATRYYAPLILDPTTGDYPTAYVIKARTFYADGTVSPTAVHTYFVSEGIHRRFESASEHFTIVSLVGENADFLGGPGGILYRENYNSRGDASERPAHIEFFGADGELLASQFGGVRVYGAYSRRNPVKSLKLFARKSYDPNQGRFRSDFFGTVNSLGNPVASYDKLVLRSYGNDWQFAFLRDELNQRLLAAAGFPFYEAVVPAVVYLNGRFYNFVWMHESYCDAYFKQRVPSETLKGEFVVIGGTEQKKSYDTDLNDIKECDEFNALYERFLGSNLADDAVFNELCRVIDVYNYLDYYAANIYVCNYDWPHNNYKVFRYYPDETGALGDGLYDGRWRFLPHDMDYCYDIYGNQECSVATDCLAAVTTPGKRYAPLFTALLKRRDCREYFIRKILRLADGAFSYGSVCAEIDRMTAEQGTEISRYIDAMQHEYNSDSYTKGSIWTSTGYVDGSLATIRAFAEARRANILLHLENAFDLPEAQLLQIAK